MFHNRSCIAVLALLTVSSCEKKGTAIMVENGDLPGHYSSKPVEMGMGNVRTWVQCDKSGKPESLGFTLSEEALEVLSTDTIGHDTHLEHDLWAVDFPKQAMETPFKHIGINWNPKGHLPAPYALPHFDLHFYMITAAEREAIPAYSAAQQKFNNLPSYDYFPINYFCPGDTNKKAPCTIGPPRELGETAEAEMGLHWIDITAPELAPVNPAIFTQTFIYGSFDGKVNFQEAMITLNFIKSTTNFSRSIPRPAKVQITGYYPKKFSYQRKFGAYVFSLEDLEYRTAQ
jgi:hypothetical protein